MGLRALSKYIIYGVLTVCMNNSCKEPEEMQVNDTELIKYWIQLDPEGQIPNLTIERSSPSLEYDRTKEFKLNVTPSSVFDEWIKINDTVNILVKDTLVNTYESKYIYCLYIMCNNSVHEALYEPSWGVFQRRYQHGTLQYLVKTDLVKGGKILEKMDLYHYQNTLINVGVLSDCFEND